MFPSFTIQAPWGIIKSAVGLAAKEMGGNSDVETNIPRTQRDLSMKVIAIGSILTIALVFLFFFFDVMQGNIYQCIVAILLVAGITFLFTTVAANAIAIVGTNPVSGMTLMTLILASVVMVAVGLKGPSGMVAALVMGGVVCTALSMAGGFITDLKIGYWIGTTPAKQQAWLSLPDDNTTEGKQRKQLREWALDSYKHGLPNVFSPFIIISFDANAKSA